MRANTAFQTMIAAFAHDPGGAALDERSGELSMLDSDGNPLPDEHRPQLRMLRSKVIRDADAVRVNTPGATANMPRSVSLEDPIHDGERIVCAVAFFHDVT